MVFYGSEAMNLEHIKAGDKIAVGNAGPRWSGANTPLVEFALYVVERVTTTQIIVGSMRVRREDGRVIGKRFTYAIEATQEIVAQNAEQIKAYEGYLALLKRFSVVEDAIRYRKISRVQMQAIVEAHEATLERAQ